MTDIKIVKGYIPGAIGRITQLHGSYYHKHSGFGLFFEAKVASMLAELLSRYDENRDGFWVAVRQARIEGGLAIDGIHADDEGAHLRFFIMSDAVRGKGIGNHLIRDAINFCENKGYERIYLWTFEGLDAARHLYEKYGFKLVQQFAGSQWGPVVNEQRFEWQRAAR